MYTIHIDSLSACSDYSELIAGYITDRSISIAFCYSSAFENTHIIRHCVESICRQLGIGKPWMHRIVLMVDELNNNAIEHGSQKSGKNEMRMYISAHGSQCNMRIECEDSGTGIHPKKAKDMDALHRDVKARGFSQHKSIRGRGLFLIIDQMVDKLYFKDSDSGGLIVGIQKNIAVI